VTTRDPVLCAFYGVLIDVLGASFSSSLTRFGGILFQDFVSFAFETTKFHFFYLYAPLDRFNTTLAPPFLPFRYPFFCVKKTKAGSPFHRFIFTPFFKILIRRKACPNSRLALFRFPYIGVSVLLLLVSSRLNLFFWEFSLLSSSPFCPPNQIPFLSFSSLRHQNSLNFISLKIFSPLRYSLFFSTQAGSRPPAWPSEFVLILYPHL